MKKCLHEKRPSPRRKRVKVRKPLVQQRAYKDPGRLLKLQARNPSNLRLIERAGAPPADRIVKAGRANIHVHPRHKRNIA